MAANGFLITVPARLTISKASYLYPHLSIPFKQVKSQLSSSSCCSSSSISFHSVFSLNKRETLLRVSVMAAPQEGNNPAVLEEERGEEVLQGIANWDVSENEAVCEESDGVVEAVGDAGEDDGYVEPPEEGKVYVGNLPYDVDMRSWLRFLSRLVLWRFPRSFSIGRLTKVEGLGL